MLVTLAPGLKSCAEMRGGDAAGVRFSELFPAFFAESRNSVCHAVEGDDEPSVVVGLGDAAVFEKVFYVRSRRDAVRRSDSRSENFDRFDFVAVRPRLHDRLPGQREAQHGLSFGSPVGRECVVKPRMRRRDLRGGHGEQDRSRAERIGREKGLAAAVAGRNAERRQCERKSREESFHASFGIFANIAKSAGWPRCRGRCVPAFGTDVSR